MQKIEKIYDLFAEEAYGNSLECRIDEDIHIDGRTPIYLQKWDELCPLFSIQQKGKDKSVEDKLFTIRFKESPNIVPSEPPSFNYLFWIEALEEKGQFTFKYIECGTVTPLPQLDIAYDDSTKIAFRTADSEQLKKNLSNNYVFDAGKYKLLFVKAWQNGGQNWNIYGIRSDKEKDTPRFIDVSLVENENKEKVRVVKKEIYSKVCFPTRFDEIDILAYENINFVDIGQAKEAHDTLVNKAHNGEALMGLWTEYSKIELKIAEEQRDDLGKIAYHFGNKPKNGIAHLVLEISPDQTSLLYRLTSSEPQFRLVCDKLNPPIVTMLKFNPHSHEADFEDELYLLPSSGVLELSLLGNEIVDKRRSQAVKQLFKGRTIVLQNLLFAIEDEADKMFEDTHKHISAWSKKTEKFLREKFGIEHLTKNQEEAVEIALNNRNDITIIQGPPGTGKTTVVAAICHRLLELADNKEKDGAVKTILASAFQNDTIEHLASKVYTHGLPTVKVGKKSLGVRAEERFIADFGKELQNEIDKRGGDSEKRVSAQLSSLAALFSKEKNVDEILASVAEIVPEDTPITDISFDRLREIRNGSRTFFRKNERDQKLVESIPTTEDEYNFGNTLDIIAEILQANFELDEKDIQFLEDIPEMNPDADCLEKLSAIKSSLHEKLAAQRIQVEKDSNDEILLWLEDAASCARKFEETNYENEDDFIRSVLSDLKDDLQGNSSYIRHSLQEYGDTVAATNQLAGSKEMKDFSHIKNVILEEAARSNPLDLLIPMVKAEDRIIMVGDQNQLPHLLESEVAERSLAMIENIDEKKEKRRLYEQSLFGIIFENVQKAKRQRCITLNEQFRMHPTIGDFISNTYYKNPNTGEGMLKSGSESLYETKQHHLSIPWAKEKTMIFCNVSNDKPESKGQSKCRQAEAAKVMSIIDELRDDPEFKNLSIGVITFYSKQVTTLFEEAAKPEHGYVIKDKDGYDIAPKYRTLDGDKEKFRIGSVDSFQGKEFDIVILSTVRSNSQSREDGNEKKVFGFLTLKNRLNVAFSRAQKLVIVVGDASMFEDNYAQKYVPGLYEFCTNITKNKPYGNRI
jgi:superfamily I DNA and/or RNA helicase